MTPYTTLQLVHLLGLNTMILFTHEKPPFKNAAFFVAFVGRLALIPICLSELGAGDVCGSGLKRRSPLLQPLAEVLNGCWWRG